MKSGNTTYYFYQFGKIKVFKKLLGQQDLCFLLSELRNYSKITNNVLEDTKEFIRAVPYNGKKKKSYVDTKVKIYKGLKQKSLLTLQPDPESVTQALKRVNLKIKIWLQSLNQNMTFSSFEQRMVGNGAMSIMVPVGITRTQLPLTVMKRSHKVKE